MNAQNWANFGLISYWRLQNVKQSREAATKSPDSPISEVGMHDCHGLDGYLEVIEPRPRGGSQSPQHSFSDNEEGLEAGQWLHKWTPNDLSGGQYLFC